MRVLGVDYGLKRIGLAVAETEVGLAFARKPVQSVGTPEADAAAIAKLAREEGFDLVVVGLPVLPSGEEGEQARISRAFGDRLASEGLAVEYVDERYTTALAEFALDHVRPKRRRAIAHSEAARILLIDYLARKNA